MTGYVTNFQQVTTQLPTPIAWEITRTDGEVCDSFRFDFPFEASLRAALSAATRFQAKQAGQVVFFGIVDDYSVSITPRGCICTLRGRGMGGILLDNEVPARTWTNATMDSILNAYAAPFGVTHNTPALSLSGNYAVALGSSAMQALRVFALNAGALPPRFLNNGALSIALTRTNSGFQFHEGELLSARLHDCRKGVISKQYSRKSGNITLLGNATFLAEGGAAQKYSAITNQSLLAAPRIALSKRERRTLQLLFTGSFLAEPSKRVQVTLPSLNLSDWFYVTQCKSTSDADGTLCELTLSQY
ncbi:MAG: hypothetical protein LBM28_01220 [Oscillospiraceae bacterium]|jgi:prophage tail gpP-like protein|nr:hypothetical protein [Oscillospiraceae bacterium]